MNNKIIVGVIVAIVLIGGGLFFVSQQSKSVQEEKMALEKSSMMEKNNAMENKDETMMKKDENMMEKDGSKMMDDSRYVEYSKSNLEKASNKRRVLFFFANWCPTCIPTDKDLKDNMSKIPEDVTVIRVNYNDTETNQEEKDLAKKYGITYQHTFVQIDSAGKEVKKWNGGKLAELLSNVK